MTRLTIQFSYNLVQYWYDNLDNWSRAWWWSKSL